MSSLECTLGCTLGRTFHALADACTLGRGEAFGMWVEE